MRRFAVVSGRRSEEVIMPARATKGSAGYDLYAAEDVVVPPGEVRIVPTGVKAYMNQGEVLLLFLRSSSGIRRGMRLANEVGVIDADYADNPDNDGEIGVAVWNPGSTPLSITRGEKIAQAIFMPFLLTDDDAADGERRGGYGSTGR